MEGYYKSLPFLFVIFCTVSSVSVRDVTFAIRTPQNPRSQNFSAPIDTAEIHPSFPIVYIVHGWTDNGSDYWQQNLTDAYLLHGNYNVIVVDWGRLASQNYFAAVSDCRPVGNLIGDSIVTIHRELNVSLKHFHLIGHSLGAQIVGFAGKRVISVTGSKVHWVTGLDAAGPLFEVPLAPRRNRLNSDDGDVVEVIHTDGGIAGVVAPIGTIDCYPNGGLYIQPGCNMTNPNLLNQITYLVECSHGKSILFYVTAVKRLGINATQCASYTLYRLGACNGNQQATFGGRHAPTQRGTYYDTIDL